MFKSQSIFRISIFVFTFLFLLSPVFLFAQQSATTTRIINSSQPFTTVHVINEQFEDKAYSVGDTVAGSFVLKNTNSTDAPEIYYVLSILTGLDQKTLRSRGQFGDTERQGPIFVAKQSDKQVDFSYEIPSFFNNSQVGEKVVLRVTAYSSSGVVTGWADKAINVTNTSKQLAEISKIGIEVNKEKFSPQQGPTIMTGQQGYFFFNIKNATTSTIIVTPEITLYDRTAGASVLGTKTYDPITIKTKSNSDQRLELPQLDNFKGVYAGKVRFIDANGVDVTGGVYIRYIVGNVYATIQSVSVDKISGINKGDTLKTSVVYTGPATNINIAPAVLGDGTMFVDITNKEGESVAKAVQSIPLDTNAENKTINLNLKSTSEASEIFISVVIKKGDEVLASYSSRLTNPDKIVAPKGNILTLLILGTLGAIFIVILSLYFLKKNKRRSFMMLVLALAFVLGGTMIPTKSALAFNMWYGINNPYDWQTVEVNSGFYSAAYAGSNVCLNAPSHIDMWLSFNWQQAYNGCDGPYDPDAHYFDNMSCAVGTYFTAPSVPGTYYVTLDVYGWNEGDYASTGGGSTYVPINVVCPAGTVWNGGACVVPTCPNGTINYPSCNACTAPKVFNGSSCVDPVINGACGTTKNSCTSGTFANLPESPTQFNWNCNGSNGGTNATCVLDKPVNGVCGTATNNPPASSAPTTNLCSVGTATPNPVTNNTSSYDWSCVGRGNGTTATCSVAHNTCSAPNTTNYPACDTCTSGNQLCSNGTCIPNSSTCPSCIISTLTSSVSPAFVATPSDTCTINWNASGTGSSCSTEISCTLDGGSTNLGQSGSKSGLSVGTHTISCKDAGGAVKTSSVKCMVTPGFGEF